MLSEKWGREGTWEGKPPTSGPEPTKKKTSMGKARVQRRGKEAEKEGIRPPPTLDEVQLKKEVATKAQEGEPVLMHRKKKKSRIKRRFRRGQGMLDYRERRENTVGRPKRP